MRNRITQDRRTFLKTLAVGTMAFPMENMIVTRADANPAPRPKPLHRTTPEAVGIDSAGIVAFLDAVEQKVGGLHSIMVLRHGQVAAEGWWNPYAPSHPHQLYSLSKSFTSTAVGFAVSEGLLTVEAPVASFFTDILPGEITENIAAMKVKHLLTMSTGHDKDALGPTVSAKDGDWVKAFLHLPIEHLPGTKFVYNSAATYMLSAIVQKLTGLRVVDYLKPRLFDPLGIEGMTWETCPKGINTGGWGLNIKTEDIARFGQLYLQKGKWEGKQIIPEKWVEEATTKHVSNGNPSDPSDWSQGYGYQFWRCRHGYYRGDGAFGQYCIVLPELDGVIAITSGVGDMQAILNAAWEHLTPAFKPSILPASTAHETLRKRISELGIAPPKGKPSSQTALLVSGKTYKFEENPQKFVSLHIQFDGKGGKIVLTDGNGDHSIPVGSKTWLTGETLLGSRTPDKIASRGAWAEPDTYVAKICRYETPYIHTFTLKFTGDQVTLTQKTNVGFGPTEVAPLVGKSG